MCPAVALGVVMTGIRVHWTLLRTLIIVRLQRHRSRAVARRRRRLRSAAFLPAILSNHIRCPSAVAVQLRPRTAKPGRSFSCGLERACVRPVVAQSCHFFRRISNRGKVGWGGGGSKMVDRKVEEKTKSREYLSALTQWSKFVFSRWLLL